MRRAASAWVFFRFGPSLQLLLRVSDLAYGDFKATTLEKTPSDLQSEILFGWLHWNGMSHTNRDNCEGSPLFVYGVQIIAPIVA